ncbi:hypothetical protein ACU686_21705 [Yinghuangia aomiensis]
MTPHVILGAPSRSPCRGRRQQEELAVWRAAGSAKLQEVPDCRAERRRADADSFLLRPRCGHSLLAGITG